MRPNASLDLSFYFGDGGFAPGSWGATSGLRSSFGTQLDEANRVGWYYRGEKLVRLPRTTRTKVGDECVDPGAVEDQMISRLSSTTWARQVEARLRMLPHLVVEVLRLHYSGGANIHGVDPCALALPQARALVLRQVYKAARQAIRDARKKRRKGEDITGTMALVRRLRADASSFRRQSLSRETLRDALHRASVDEAETLAELARTTLSHARDAYESTVLPKQLRRVS